MYSTRIADDGKFLDKRKYRITQSLSMSNCDEMQEARTIYINAIRRLACQRRSFRSELNKRRVKRDRVAR